MRTLAESSPGARAARTGRIPDFFIVGHAKCGTTALYEALMRHPQVFMPKEKEPHYFARTNPHPQEHGERSIAYTGRKRETLEEYLALFADARSDERVGEGSTSYLWSKEAPRAIAAARPDAKIIAILREPASFLRSLHLQLLTNHTESETDFARALALDEERRAGRSIPKYAYWPQAIIYSDRVRYVEQLKRYHEVFPPEQVLVLIYDDYRERSAETFQRVLRLLEVDPGEPMAVAESNTTSRRVRSNRVNDLARMLNQGRGPVSGALNAGIKAVTSPAVRTRVLRPVYRRVLYGTPHPSDEELTRELRVRFAPEVHALSEYLGRDLVKLWGYGDLA
jgi:Sulfotransferase family